MKTILLVLIALVTLGQYTLAQEKNVMYKYDNAGNRVKRTVITLKSAIKAVKEDFVPVEDQWGERQVTIYPNPTHGNLKINITGGEADVNYHYDLYNTGGAKVLTGQIIQHGENPVPMQRLSPGVYILILQTGEEKQTYKIIKN